jgi:hypothetical protein
MDGFNAPVHPVVPGYLAHTKSGADPTPIPVRGNPRVSAPPVVITPRRPGISVSEILPVCRPNDDTQRAPMAPRYQC